MLCYFEFAANYQTSNSNSKITETNKDRIINLKDRRLGKKMKRTSPQIVRSHTPSNDKDSDKYYYSKICLYYPWINEPEIQGSCASLEHSFLEKFDTIKNIE